MYWNAVIFDVQLLERLVQISLSALPHKAYGIITGNSKNIAQRLYPLYSNLRAKVPEINSLFESYGEFYCDKDRGFWCEPVEQYRLFTEIEEKGEQIIAVYHTHRCLQATPSKVDIELHYDPEILSVIVSLINPSTPKVKVFQISNGTYKEVKLKIMKQGSKDELLKSDLIE